MARDPRTPDCSIADCSRAAYLGKLCAKHYAMVPQDMKLACMIECMRAQHLTAAKHHAKQLVYVKRILAAERLAARSA